MDKYALQTASEFILPDGKKIKIKPVSLARVRGAQNKSRKELESRGLKLDTPTRPISGVMVAPGVETPTEEYTDATIVDAPEDIQKEFLAVKANRLQLDQLTAAYMLVTLLLRGTEVEIPDDGWDKRQISDGMEIPEDPEERYVYYLNTELLIPPVLAQECAKQILRVSLEGADPRVMKAFEDSFRGPLQDTGRGLARADKKQTPKG